MGRWAATIPWLAGIVGLGGQGLLLLAAGRGAEAPRLESPWLLHGIALLTAASFWLVRVRNRDGAAGPRTAAAVAATLLLIVGFRLVDQGPAPEGTSRADDRLDRAAQTLVESERGLLSIDAAELLADTASGGDYFRRFDDAAGAAAADGLPVGLALWRGGQRVAWSGSALPLEPCPPGDADGSAVWYRRGEDLILRRCTGHAGFTVDGHVVVARAGRLVADRRVEATVAPADEDEGAGVWRLVDTGAGPLTLRTAGADRAGALADRARGLVAAWVVWLAALGCAAAVRGGRARLLAALWIGRAFLARGELKGWLATAFPGEEFPVAPGAWQSLLDPAYFASPVVFGWFASTADALLTALLIVVTVHAILDRRGVLAGGRPAGAWLPDRPLAGALVFGVAVAALVSVLTGLAAVLATNANPRLIGTGASFSALPFWGLHAVLLAVGFSFMALMVMLPAGGRWYTDSGRARWAAPLAAAGVAVPAGAIADPDGAGLVLVAVVAAGVWILSGWLTARARLLRRLVGPALVLLVVFVNHHGLQKVYERSEGAWLERKAGRITAGDRDWIQYLLGSVLADMQAQDEPGAAAVPPTEIWRDEAAWRLWRRSALHDLGYACQVEVLGTDESTESWYARGFLRDYRFEVAARSEWTAPESELPGSAEGVVYQTERRNYLGGEEEVLIAEAPRTGGRGWLRIEVPLRSWRISTLLSQLTGAPAPDDAGYRPRTEVDRPLLLLLADDSGWLQSGDAGFPGRDAEPVIAALRAGERDRAEITVGGERWTCLWQTVPEDLARTAGEGFLLGLRRPPLHERLLDLSRLMLLDLVFFAVGALAVQSWRWLRTDPTLAVATGFQEKFLAGYLALGLALLLVVGVSVDRVGYERVREEARMRTRQGLAAGVEQLRSLLSEQARSLAGSNYILELLRGQAAGERPAGSEDVRQGMVFLADGRLLLDETLSGLDEVEARTLLDAARSAPMVLIRDGGVLYAGVVVPVDLSDELVADAGDPTGAVREGFFLYRQRLDTALVGGLADLLRGEVNLAVDGLPVLSSHPAAYFAGGAPPLAAAATMAELADHPHAAAVVSVPGRPFSFTGGQPLPALARDATGRLVPRTLPAVLTVAFPDRARAFEQQRRATVLFLTGLANLILLTALVLAALMSWNLFRPLRLLLGATRSLARGDFEAPLPEAGRDEVGSLAGAFGAMRTQLQSARDELAARERFLAAVLAQVPVGVAVVPPAGALPVLNPAGREILAGFAAELEPADAARNLLDLLPPDGADSGPVAGEARSSDGRRTVRAAAAPLALDDGGGARLLVVEDVTDFLAHKKAALNAELARQVAHEIKNPLTPIQLSTQLIGQAVRDRHPRLDEIASQSVERILDQVDLLRRIASEFSLLGRPGELPLAPLDFGAVVSRVVAAYTPGAGEGDALQVDGPPEIALPPVRGHDESLVKILGNLMQNALDAARPEVPLVLVLRWETSADAVTLVWTDNGSGLAPDVADRLFEPYFSTKSKGTGLGLAICRNLAEAMGGSISLADRTDGPGVEARLTLPTATAEQR